MEVFDEQHNTKLKVSDRFAKELIHSQKTSVEKLFEACFTNGLPNMEGDPINFELSNVRIRIVAAKNDGKVGGDVMYIVCLDDE